jgi:predicted GIY-YIG superfamily endonuclease
MKGWPRRWKLNLNEAENPDWRDLADDTFDPWL